MAAASESRRPTRPKSWPWLLAMVATSTPASLRAVRADGGARKVKSLGAGVPRSVMAVSRLTTARSARFSTLGDRAEGGGRVGGQPGLDRALEVDVAAEGEGDRLAGRLPGGAGPLGGGGRALGGRRRLGGAGRLGRRGRLPGSSPAPPQALSNASAATVSEATRWRRRGRDGRWGGRGTADSRVGRSGKRCLGSHAVTRRARDAQRPRRRVVEPGRAHRVAARRPRRAQDRAHDVVGPRGHPGRPQQPAKAPCGGRATGASAWTRVPAGTARRRRAARRCAGS